jgi:hypothetical protein
MSPLYHERLAGSAYFLGSGVMLRHRTQGPPLGTGLGLQNIRTSMGKTCQLSHANRRAGRLWSAVFVGDSGRVL